MKFLKQFVLALLAAVGGLALTMPITGCSAAQEQAFLSNAPAVLQGSLATATDLYAAYAAANQQLNGQKLTIGTGITAAQAAANNLQSSNLATAVTNVFDGLNALGASLKTAGASSQQIVAAQSAQLVAAQVATKAATSPTGTTTTMFRLRYNHMTHEFVVEKDYSQSEKRT